jgi:glycosyltransferase involved in cell wall biosynthesis
MKILLVSSYEEGRSAWSRAAQNICRALDLVGVDVVPHSYKLNTSKPQVHEQVRALEKKDKEGCDVILHVGLPHHFSWDSRFLNVGYFFTETKDYTYSSWVSHINLLDLAIVPNIMAVEAAEKSGVVVPIEQCVVPMDSSIYEEKGVLPEIEALARGDYLFYFIGDASLRKGLPLLLRAFYTEFSINEPVNLVIKTSKYGMSADEIRNAVKDTVNNVQAGLRVSNEYAKPIIVGDDLPDREMVRLHNTCDCLVAPSFGEAWGFPVLDAIGCGNEVITSDTGGFSDYSPRIIPSFPTRAFGVESFPGIMTARETWDMVDLDLLSKEMRKVYNLGKTKTSTDMEDFSLEHVGGELKRILEEAYENHR